MAGTLFSSALMLEPILNKAMPGGKMNPGFILYDYEIEKIIHPTLWLWGTSDLFGGVKTGQRLHAKMKNSAIQFFKDSRHLPWIDQPENHALAIKAFVQISKR